MNGGTNRFRLVGSQHVAVPGTLLSASVGAEEQFRIDIILRRRSGDIPFPSLEALGATPPRQRKYLTSEELEERYGADPGDVDLVQKFAVSNELVVESVSLASRTVTLSGSAAQFAKAFGVGFKRFTIRNTVYRAHVGEVSVPGELGPIVLGVLGLDERPASMPALARHPGLFNPFDLVRAQIAAHGAAQKELLAGVLPVLNNARARMAGDPAIRNLAIKLGALSGPAPSTRPAGQLAELVGAAIPARRSIAAGFAACANVITSAETNYYRAALLAYINALAIHTPKQVAEIYQFPDEVDGKGEVIGIIEMGGGYHRSDLEAYFKLIDVPMPTIVDVAVAGGANRPPAKRSFRSEEVGDLYSSEVYLDIEVAGAMAPGARLVCYFAPLTTAGFIAALNAAIHDRVNRPSTISISWSISEAAWLGIPTVIACFEEVLKDAALLGITVCCASGDYGATSEIRTGAAWVDYPSSSPHVLSCGGTHMLASSDRLIAEAAWNTLLLQGQATGGGISSMFPPPEWQRNANVPVSINPGARRGRGIPDVSAVSDPMTGYFLRVGNDWTAMAGTSAAAPLWCALVARISQSLGTRVGYINPLLYKIANAETFTDILLGNNGGYRAGPGWDACTGLGTPIGSKLLEALSV